ncbi:hypothetical protein ACQRVR_004823 [Enterobacter cloacae]|uniref:hypothetical protein n=1 Tax=Enterobacter TaxID=547 RepID=UPI00073D051E|nr:MULTISPECIES: hypothetical protein [Enterobacter]KSY76732.1 hypothetical protein APU11_23080 [Enterobacter sp. 50793107]MCK7131616.1 hypothetical protein [Enterobacter roggenkampii]MDN3750929.1 hypothetical protein [Enterobacter roggenkampii]MDN3760040.1 hypothetical protein [Enterobacter roggenkampii]MDN3770486.1 hypothetical protein [Enterobacter roggenkampii]
MSRVIDKELHVTMPDSSVWAVPVQLIATHRAEHYAKEFGGDLYRSLAEDTLPLFRSDDFEIEDWAANNMNWSDVQHAAKCIYPGDVDFQEGWVNGDKEVKEAVQ